MASKTFRLSLNSDIISFLLDNSRLAYSVALQAGDTKASNTALAAISKLAVYQTKIANNGIAVAYTAASNIALTQAQKDQGVLQSLGGTNTELMAPVGFNKTDYWQRCYEKELSVGVSKLSTVEIQGSREHKYLNDLMTADELTHFEANAV